MADKPDTDIRAFVALPLPNTVREKIRRAQDALGSHRFKIRWVRPGSIHLTLKFLGDVSSMDVDRIHTALVKAVGGMGSLTLFAKGFGVFPNIRKPRVLWVGVSGDTDGLFECQRQVEEELARIGFPADSRRFKAHLTIGRSKGPIDGKRLMGAFAELEDFESPRFTVESVILYQSQLKPQGAVYTILHKIHLS
ncbi:2'-5' RNA ligase [Olavius algarvensis associated proteobacterium Delta 3]|nr:2'-5' RNA ligase [Olavius algarvensis associated proteobacterium Delta 3]CAB5119779.1 2'-5' RNA ligase [Olavius algarvensis associated proteobacterium Delta 3]